MLYKGERIIHSDILKQYEQEYEGNLDLVIKRATSKQTIIKNKSKEIKSLKEPENLENFLK